MTIDAGSDISCVDDLADDGRSVSGTTVIAQAVARRWSTPRGRLIDDPNYGFDLTGYLNDDMSPKDLASLQAGAEAEALKDERVSKCTTSAELDANGLLTITGLLESSEGPFTLVVAVSSTSLDLLAVT